MRKSIANGVAGVLEHFYPTAKARYMWRMRRAYDAAPGEPILVLQMGKVGSMSVQAGLEQQNLPSRIYHVHFLSVDRTLQTENDRRSYFRTERHSDLVRPWLNQFLLNQYRNDASGKRWKIVTLTREPIARNLSAFFENLEVRNGDQEGDYVIQSDYYGIDPITVSVDQPSDIADLFFSLSRHDSPIEFFDREIRDIFGIDVYAESFPTELGYKVYSSDRADLLVLKLEKLKDCATRAFEEFLGIEDFQLVQKNVGARKIYAPLYDSAKKKMKVPAEYADHLYSSKYMKTFYSEEEIESARQRWHV